jgi:hypothetical protein
VGEFAKQNKAQNYPKTGGVNVADIWSESKRSYLGRSDRNVVEIYFETTTHAEMCG